MVAVRAILRRAVVSIVAIVAIVTAVPLIMAAAIDAGYCRSLLLHAFSAKLHRPVAVDGEIRAHLLSTAPELSADGVRVGNPAWMPPGTLARVEHLELQLRLPSLSHRAGIVGLEARGASLELIRDAKGHANWQLNDSPDSGADERSAIIRRLSLPDAQAVLHDAQRHLEFVGTVSAQGAAARDQLFTLRGIGQLNGRAATLEVTGDSLATASHRSAYHFTFQEHSGASDLKGRGSLPQPFAFDVVEATFTATGPTLKDLYFLTGTRLLDTATYRLTGGVSRRKLRTQFTDLTLTTGMSEIHGTLSIDSGRNPRQYRIDLRADNLRMADFGTRAAHPEAASPPERLLSDAALSPAVLESGDSILTLRVQQLQLGQIPLTGLRLEGTVTDSVLTVQSLTTQVLGGTARARLILNAHRSPMAADADLTLTDLHIERLARRKPEHPPAAGLLQARISVTGRGNSVHKVAASADGNVRLKIRSGALRKSFAELTGVDLRGLGFLLAGNKDDTPLRCASADLVAHQGELTVKNLVADTDAVLITGEGHVQLESEAFDLTLRGQPKGTRLVRLRAPVLVRGTFSHPSFAIDSRKGSLALIDAGSARDVNCSSLLAVGASGK